MIVRLFVVINYYCLLNMVVLLKCTSGHKLSGSRKGPWGQVAGYSQKHFTILKPQPYKALWKLQFDMEKSFPYSNSYKCIKCLRGNAWHLELLVMKQARCPIRQIHLPIRTLQYLGFHRGSFLDVLEFINGFIEASP